MARRMRSAPVRRLLADLDRAAVRVPGSGPVAAMDGSAVRVGPHSGDRHAAFGHAGGVKAKGYRLHLLLRGDGTVADWRLTPPGGPLGCEKRMARRTLRAGRAAGYVVADGNYDADPPFAEAGAAGAQLVAPKRRGGFGNRPQRPGRRRSRALLTNPWPAFGAAAAATRAAVERYFGALKSSSAGLTHLPPWVWTFPRVRPYVTARLVAQTLRRAAS